jgi:ATP-dependent RNA helicase DDX19/DBP5
VSLVINFELPVIKRGDRILADPETYLHRIGRTGRWDRKGIAVNFVHDAESGRVLKDIEKHYGHEIKAIKDVEELERVLKEKW